MTWARIDDQFRHHPKVVQAGPLGIALHVCGLSYTAEYLTDGFIPGGAVNTLCDFAGVWHRGYPPGSQDDYTWTVREVVKDLVAAGMWDEVEGGYQIHDYLDYNPSREKTLAERAKKQAAGRAGGKASASTRAQASAQAESKPVPVPQPVPKEEGVLALDVGSASSGTKPARSSRTMSFTEAEFQRFYQAFPLRKGPTAARKAFGKALAKTDLETLVAAAERYRDDPTRSPEHTKWPQGWLNDERWLDESAAPERPAASPWDVRLA
jgi:hypothetical protein